MHALSNPMRRGELALAVISGGLGFALADFADRYFATYDPSATGTAPTDRFTGGTNGTLANTLNIAAPPSLTRIGVGVGMTALPAIGAYLVKNPMGRAALQGMMLGAGIKLFSTLWNAYVMGNLLKPADTSQATMQKSLGARLYPAETVAAQNMAANPPALTSPQGLNAPPRGAQPSQQYRPSPQAQRGVGDPGPFAVAGPGCPDGTVPDALTGQCLPVCADGSAPAGGQCPPTSTTDNGAAVKTNVPSDGCEAGCGLSSQLPEFLGFMSES